MRLVLRTNPPLLPLPPATMPTPLLLLLLLLAISVSANTLRGSQFINCGDTNRITFNDLTWLPDESFIQSGTLRKLNLTVVHPIFSTFRSFTYSSSDGPRKFCYEIPIYTISVEKYLLRTTYFYGGEAAEPPVFDQLVDGTFWTTVNTTEDRRRGLASYYEMVYLPKGRKSTSVCVAGNFYTEGDPFISAIELVILPNSTYNGTDFERNALGLIARSNFGYSGTVLRYPDDPYHRFWQPFINNAYSTRSSRNVSVSGFWNLPPSKIFETSMVAENDKPLELKWPRVPLRNSTYYIALYFLDSSSQNSRRVLDIYINGISFYKNLSVLSSGISVFSTNWILSGPTNVRLVPASGSGLPPLINGGEVYGLMTTGNVTTTQDVIALFEIKKQIKNPPIGWEGDPCLPKGYPWPGIICSMGSRVRVTALNLANMGLSGTLSPYVSNITALTNISLSNNTFSGTIPDLRRLQKLERLHLQNNQFNGTLPSELGKLRSLQELYVQNNNLTGEIPASLRNKPGLVLRTSPGNNFTETRRS